LLKVDLHIHSIASGHALNTVYELAEVANQKGLSMIGIADHCPNMEGAPHSGYFEISRYTPELIHNVHILMGCELNILNTNGEVDLSNEILKLQDIVFAGLHKRTSYRGQSIEENTTAIINTMNNPFIQVISHPFRPEFPIDVEEVVKAASKKEVLLEVNCLALSRSKKNKKMINNTKTLIQLAQKHGVPLVISSDAHVAENIGKDTILEELNLKRVLQDGFILNRSIETVMKFLSKKSNMLKRRF